jgi:retrograde regulation protein 2
MPSIWAERAGISLYDAQHPKGAIDKVPIPKDIIKDVTECMIRFKSVCNEYGVPDANVQVVATEATR